MKYNKNSNPIQISTNRNKRKINAQKHVKKMNQLYKDEIANSVENSLVYSDVFSELLQKVTEQYYVNSDVVSALYDCYVEDKKICLLNFASYRHPGGGFLGGSMAQEEALCHESILYNVLSSDRLSEYYKFNNEHPNNNLYLNRAIYSRDILFTRNNKLIKADVLTCAAPNVNACNIEGDIEEINHSALLKRMEFIASVLDLNQVNVFIAGAFGCGVFGQSPEDIANIWKNLKYGKDLEYIIHPVIGNENNARVFRENFKI